MTATMLIAALSFDRRSVGVTDRGFIGKTPDSS